MAFNSSERIERMLVEEGERVDKNDLLAVLESRPLELSIAKGEVAIEKQELDNAWARYKAAAASVDNARETYRLSELGPRYEDIAEAEAHLKGLRADLLLQKYNLSQTKLYSPVNGVVGSLFTLYLVLLVFLLSCVGIGLSISAVSANMQQVMVYCFMAMMPLSLLSGVTTPVRNMPQVLQYFALANPLRFATEAVRRIFLKVAAWQQWLTPW